MLRERCRGVVCIGCGAAYFLAVVHGWTFRYETPPVRSNVANIAGNHPPGWVCYGRALAYERFFVKFFSCICRNTVHHSNHCKFGMGCVRILFFDCPLSAHFGSTLLAANLKVGQKHPRPKLELCNVYVRRLADVPIAPGNVADVTRTCGRCLLLTEWQAKCGSKSKALRFLYAVFVQNRAEHHFEQTSSRCHAF